MDLEPEPEEEEEDEVLAGGMAGGLTSCLKDRYYQMLFKKSLLRKGTKPHDFGGVVP